MRTIPSFCHLSNCDRKNAVISLMDYETSLIVKSALNVKIYALL